jgi:hypothetical protein
VTECIEGLTLKHTKQGEFRFSLCNQKVENYPVVFESFRVGSAKPKLAGSIPALRTLRDVPRWQSNYSVVFLG